MRGCSTEYHAEAKRDPDRVRASWEFIGVSDFKFALFELFNCRCGSTLSVVGIGPVAHEDDDAT